MQKSNAVSVAGMQRVSILNIFQKDFNYHAGTVTCIIHTNCVNYNTGVDIGNKLLALQCCIFPYLL